VPVTWTLSTPAVEPPGVIEAGSDLAPDSPIDIGVPYYYVEQDFLDLVDTVLPNWYVDPLKASSASDNGGVTSGSGYELLQAFGAMFEVASLAVGQLQCLATLAYSSGGEYARASVMFYRTSLASGTFTVKAGTVVKTSATNRGYQTTYDFTFGSSDWTKTVLVQSLGQDQDYNVRGPVVTSDGTVLPGEIDTVTLPIMNPPYAEPGISVQQVADAYGGCPPALDQLGADRGIPRVAGESDANYKKRARALPDTVSPAAIRRHLDAIFYPQSLNYDLIETWENRYQSCWNAPIGGPGNAVFGTLVNFAFNDTSTERFVPRWMGEVDHRSAMVVVVPNFPVLEERGMAFNDPALTPDKKRAVSAWNSPVPDSFSLSGAWNADDDVGPLARSTFLHALWDLLRSIKAAGVNVALIPAEVNEPLPGAPYP
jgi:hypothetical protein